jgi:hypothetical protein
LSPLSSPTASAGSSPLSCSIRRRRRIISTRLRLRRGTGVVRSGHLVAGPTATSSAASRAGRAAVVSAASPTGTSAVDSDPGSTSLLPAWTRRRRTRRRWTRPHRGLLQ